jgi:hypothetical protein
MPIQSSGEINFSDIANNQNSASLANLSLQTLSETFASGSIVDGSGAQTTARLNLDNAPYAISEFYDADFSSDEFSSIVITTPGGTSDFNLVDGEDLTVAFATTQTGVHTVQLVDSSGNVDDSETNSPSSGTVSVTFSSLALTDDTYTPRLRLGFLTQDGTNINYHDAITVGAITDPSDTTVANNSVTTNIEHQVNITNDNAFNDINWTFAKSSGDGSAPSNITNSSDRSPTVSYTGVGVFTISCRVDGLPTQARNSANASNNGVSHRIDYTKAVSIGNPSDVNSGGTINTSVTHQGFSSGVDVDLIRASDNAVLLSNDHTTDSRVTKVTNQNQTFTAPDQANTTLSVKVKAFDGSDVATSNAFDIFPLLTTSKNVINFGTDGSPSTSKTIYSTTNNNDTGNYPTSFVIASPSNRTDNVTQGTYTEQADSSNAISLSGDLTPSSQTTTQPTVSAGSAVGNATVRYTVDGNSSQQTATDGSVAVNYMPRIYSVGTPDIAGNNTNSNALSISFNWQGLAVASARYELFNDEDTSTQLGNDVNSASPDAGGAQSQNASGTVNFTSLASTFGHSTAGTFVIKVSLFSGASQNGSSITAFSPSFTSVTATSFALIGRSGTFRGYDTMLEGAEQASSATATKYRFGSISDGSVIYNNIDTTTAFDGGSKAFNFNGEVFIINGSGVVSALRSDTPTTPSFSQQSVATDDITIRVANYNALVTRKFRISVQVGGGVASEKLVDADSQGASITQDISLKNDAGYTLSSGTTHTIKIRAENNHTESPFTATQDISTALNTSWSSVPTLSSVPYLEGETYISDVFAITLSEGTGNTTVDLGTDISSPRNDLLIQIAASTSDSTPGSGTFTTLQAAESGGGRSQFSIAHTSGVLYFVLKTDDELENVDNTSDDAFTMTFTNNSTAQVVNGTLRAHSISSSDTASANSKMLYGEDDIVFGTVKRSDEFIITVAGCATGDQVAFTLSRTGDNFNDIQNLKMAVNTTNGTDAYNSSGVAQGTGVQETTAVSVGGTRTLTFSSLSAGTNTFTGMLRSNGDGSEPSVESTQTGNLTVKATYTNSSGNTIANQTIHTAQVQFDPGI